MPLDRKDRAIATVMAGIRKKQNAPPRQKEAILPEDLIAMLEQLDRGSLRGLRGRAELLIGFAGGLRRSEITGLDLGRDQTEDSCCWIKILDRGHAGDAARQDRLGLGRDRPWVLRRHLPHRRRRNLDQIRQDRQGSPLPPRDRPGKNVGPNRLNDQEVAHLVKKTAMAAGIHGALPEKERDLKPSGHSLRAGLASSAEVDERYVQKQLGHASAEMTLRHQGGGIVSAST
ncbi:tyrosine-type recombinase/integrase [Rhizobium sp. RU36D]|uniref:tyrosine-type recombinase/integrase n=1 Tax=Rhizobium sp. RU36D TaxID=1907415 RepID=UPI0015C482E1|nr:tyrosine-type recombinase/integrase [Rhizobium sp. RU36D]